MPRAKLVLHEKQVEEDGSIVELKIWSVPPESRYAHGIKYSLVYIRDGKRMLGYDNAHGQDHRHFPGQSQPYLFRSIQVLLRDFRRDLNRIKQEGQK